MLNNAMRGKVKLTKTILLTAICFSQGQVHLWNFELEFLFRKKILWSVRCSVAGKNIFMGVVMVLDLTTIEYF